uniref:Uncharacterized protein n=1 Tax=Oryza meridionalis TaxID=40149 RepID=A0A0E0F651_9ORYZ
MGVSAAAPPFPYHWWTPQDVTALPSTSPGKEEEGIGEDREERRASAAAPPPPYRQVLPTYLRLDLEGRSRCRCSATGERSGGEGNQLGRGVRHGERGERNRWRRRAQDLAYFNNVPSFVGGQL